MIYIIKQIEVDEKTGREKIIDNFSYECDNYNKLIDKIKETCEKANKVTVQDKNDGTLYMVREAKQGFRLMMGDSYEW